MPGDRLARLEGIAGWTWNSYDSRWEEGFAHLKEYGERTGHVQMSVRLKAADGYALGAWVRQQHRNRPVMSAERVARLEALTGWVWRAI